MHSFMLMLYALSCVFGMITVGYAVNKEADEGQKYIIVFLFAVTLQSFGCFFELLDNNAEAVYTALRVQYLGQVFSLMFVCKYIFYICKIKSPKLFFKILAVIDVLCGAAMCFDDKIHLFYSDKIFVDDSIHPHFEVSYGPVFYIYFIAVFCIPLLLSAAALFYCTYERKSKQFLKRAIQFVAIVVLALVITFIFKTVVTDKSYKIMPFVVCTLLCLLEWRFWGKTTFDFERISMKVLAKELDEAILIVDDMKRVVECNDVAYKLFPKLKGNIVPEEMIREDNTLCSMENMYHYNGRIYEKHIKTIQNRTGEVNGRLIMLYDVTKLYEDMEELRILQEESEAANIAKSKFLANMSHEIRTPINAILGMNAIILQETEDSKLQEYSTDIKEAGEALLAIVNDILDLSKIESGKMELILDEYNFGDMVNGVVKVIQFQAMKKNLKLIFELDEGIPAGLLGDVVRIRQVLINILNNAVKYTNEGQIVFSIKELERENDYIVMEFLVKDTGIGIPAESIPHLFEPFERIDEQKNRFIEGTGLGIPFVVQILRLMDTKLEVESKYGVGSMFHFKLRQKITNNSAVGNLADKIQKNDNVKKIKFVAPMARILVVDDNKVNCKVFSGLLRSTKIKIDEAYSGEECLDYVTYNHYDMIFLDHMMPVMDGVETLKKMSTLEENMSKGVPVIALTANAVVGAKEQYLNAGFDDFLPKPIKYDELEEMIIRLLPKERLNVLNEENEAKKSKSVSDLPDVSGFAWRNALRMQPDMNELIKIIFAYYKALVPNSIKLQECYDKMFSEELSEKESDEAKNNFIKQLTIMKNQSAKVGAVQMQTMANTLLEGINEGNYELVRGMTIVFLKEWNGIKEWMPECFKDTEYEKKIS